MYRRFQGKARIHAAEVLGKFQIKKKCTISLVLVHELHYKYGLQAEAKNCNIIDHFLTSSPLC